MKLRLFAVMAIAGAVALIAAGSGVGDVTRHDDVQSIETDTWMPEDVDWYSDYVGFRPDLLTPQFDAQLALGDVQGLAVDAQTGQAIGGVDVELFRVNGTPVDSTTTAANGRFSFPALPDFDYYITLNTPGYMETKIWTNAPADTVTQLPEGKMVREPVILHGTAAGFIRNALTGGPLSGVDLEFRRGINAPTTEPVLYTARTAFTGRYIVNNMRAGVYTARAAATTNMCESNIVVWTQGGKTIDNQNAALSQALLAGQMRIVLTWGATPSDLDSHLWAPHYGCNAQNPYHLYFAARQCGVIVNLDVDDTTSFGPETTTIGVSQTPVVGQTYSFLVHDYSNLSSGSSQAMSNSQGLEVNVYSSGGSSECAQTTFTMPPNTPATVWHVFTAVWDGAYWTINPIPPQNAFCFQSNAGSVGPACP